MLCLISNRLFTREVDEVTRTIATLDSGRAQPEPDASTSFGSLAARDCNAASVWGGAIGSDSESSDHAADDGSIGDLCGALGLRAPGSNKDDEKEPIAPADEAELDVADGQCCLIPGCDATPDAQEWGAQNEILQPDGSITSEPAGRLCKKHLKVCDSFPDMTPEDIKDKLEADSEFKTVFSIAANNYGIAPLDNPFMPRRVSRNIEVGRTWSVDVRYVDPDVYEKHFGCTVAQGGAKLTTAYNAAGDPYLAVPMHPAEVPETLANLHGTLFVKEYMKMEDFYVQPHEQLRDAQAMDTLKYLVLKDEDEKRGKGLKADNLLNLQTYSELKRKAQKCIDARTTKEAEMQANFTASRSGTERAPVVTTTVSRFGGPSLLSSSVDPSSRLSQEQPVLAKRNRAASAQPKAPPVLANLKRSRVAPTATAIRSLPASQAKSTALNSFASPGQTKRPAETMTPNGSEASSRSKLSASGGTYYKHKEINIQEILDGAAPGRQTGPVQLGRAQNYKL
jgi:hypothetical protein